MKRRMIGARDVTNQMADHPFFANIGMKEPVSGYLKTITFTLEDHLSRLAALTDETSVLISLVSPFLFFRVVVLHNSLCIDIQYFGSPRYTSGDGREPSC